MSIENAIFLFLFFIICVSSVFLILALWDREDRLDRANEKIDELREENIALKQQLNDLLY